ncbi:MAG TPA: ABC transporter permease, partial [Microthrixaceae bacterium]|nr:ABC transporter permease [Microthrixaceae bacterium]
MDRFLNFTITGIPVAAVYAIAATGLVVTYTTSGIFNFAHGAIGMLAAFTYWQLHVDWGLSTPLSLLLVIGVIAPLFGAVVERVLIRGIEGASEVVKIVVSVSLMVGLLGLARLVWPTGVSRQIQPFFAGETTEILGTTVDYHRVIMVVVAVIVAVLLWWFMRYTRSGVTMRAVVDDRSLLQLNGGRPFRMSMLSWALGACLAAVAGVLIAPLRNLEAASLTLMVVTAYSAAAVGRLRSIPLTFLGALIVGLTESYLTGYVSPTDTIGFFQLDKLGAAVSPIVLFVALVFMPQARLRSSGVQRQREHWKMPTLRNAWIGGVVLVLATAGIASLIEPVNELYLRDGLFTALVVLSLVPLTGFAGQISLAQMTFAGLGGVIAGVMGSQWSPLGAVVGVVVTAAVGALIALPALRLQGIYLALGTAAFAMLMYQIFFIQEKVMPGSARQVPPLKLGGIEVSSNSVQSVVLAIAFALVGVGLVALRRGAWGRRLSAMKDSPVACATLGLDLTRTKLGVFALSAAIAGMAGAISGQTFTADTLRLEASLPITMMAVVGGVGAISGALFGGLVLGVFPVMDNVFAAANLGVFRFFSIPVTSLTKIMPGLMGVSLGRNPNGAVSDMADAVRPLSSSARAMGVGALTAFGLWGLAYGGIIDGWQFTAAIAVLLLAVLPLLPALVSPGGSDHLLALALSVALLVGACSIGWEGMTSSNGLRFVALMAYA